MDALPVLATEPTTNIMMTRIAEQLISRSEKAAGESLDYLRVVAQHSPAGFWKFGLLTPLLSHRGSLPAETWHLCRLGATQAEDCGPCLKTVVAYARADGIAPELIRAAVAGGAELADEHCDAYLFGRLVASGEPMEAALRDRIESRFGTDGLVDLSLAAAVVRIFPALKRGMGYAQSCSLTEVSL
jgi:alkylhydroperoxidase/carboxymuconolactone decarboxylase family protein YurZ